MSKECIEIPVDKIDVDWDWNSRKNITLESVTPLANSIEKNGQDEPVVVRPVGDRYSLVAGFRRYKAIAEALGRETILAYVEDLDEYEAKLRNFRENGEREQLTFWEECLYIKEVFPPEYNMKMIQDALNKNYDWLRPRRQIWTLPEAIINLTEQGVYSPKMILELLKRSKPQQYAAAKAAVAAQKRGEKKAGIRKATTIRRRPQGRKNMAIMMNIIDENDLISDKKFQHIMLWALGDLCISELAQRLRVDPEIFIRIEE